MVDVFRSKKPAKRDPKDDPRRVYRVGEEPQEIREMLLAGLERQEAEYQAERECRRKWGREVTQTNAQEGLYLDEKGAAVLEAFVDGEFELSELVSRMKALRPAS